MTSRCHGKDILRSKQTHWPIASVHDVVVLAFVVTVLHV